MDCQWYLCWSCALHIGAKCPFIFRWGFGKPLLRIQGFTENKKCSPEKISRIKYLQIDTLHIHKLEFINLELACPRPGQQKFFWANAKIEGSNVKNQKSHVKKIFSFHFFVNFSTDSKSSVIKFFRTGSKCAYILKEF